MSGTPVSTQTSVTVNGATLTITANADAGRMELAASGGPAGDPLYITRRDLAGTSLVRETSAGSVLWVTAGATTSSGGIVDYEARQGLDADYTLTDRNGSPLVNVRLTVPEWGTWLKAPGKPHLNTRCAWQDESEFTRESRQVVIAVRGARFPVVHTDRPQAPTARVSVVTDTTSQAAQLTSLLDDGAVLMIDVPASYSVPVRYVSVAKYASARLPGQVLVDSPTRVWTMETVEVAPPVGLPTGQGFTYDGLAMTADSYISLGSTYASYNTMAVGEV